MRDGVRDRLEIIDEMHMLDPERGPDGGRGGPGPVVVGDLELPVLDRAGRCQAGTDEIGDALIANIRRQHGLEAGEIASLQHTHMAQLETVARRYRQPRIGAADVADKNVAGCRHGEDFRARGIA